MVKFNHLKIQMKAKKKRCDGCNNLQYIWKNANGKRFCKSCWSAHSACNHKPTKKLQKPLPLLSPKRRKQLSEYSKLRKEYLNKYPLCQAKLPGICTHNSTDIHHKAGRSGDLYLDTDYWLSVCRACHIWITDNSKKAIELGLSSSRLENNLEN